MKTYSPETIACHEEWCRYLREHMHAKVELVWGVANRERLTRSLNLSKLPLWGPFKDTELYLEWNVKTERSLRRLILFVNHPEFFLHNYDANFAWVQDQKINAAAALASVKVETHFFTKRTERLMRLKEAQDRPEAFAKIGRVPEKDHFRTQNLERAERYFRTTSSVDDEIYAFTYLPNSMKDWLQGGQATFSGDAILDEYGLALAYQEAFHPDEVRNNLELGLKRMVFSLFCRHQTMSGRAMIFDTIAEFVEVRENMVIPLKCSGCSRRLLPDRLPRFCKAEPDTYVARETRSCRSVECETRMKLQIPQDESIPWVRPNKKKLAKLSGNGQLSLPQLKAKETSIESGPMKKRVKCDTIGGNDVFSTNEYLALPPNPLELRSAVGWPIKNTAREKLPYIMVPIHDTIIERKCASCGDRSLPDEGPRFWATDTRVYVARQTHCNSETCNGRGRWLIPEQPDYGWIQGNLEHLSAKPRLDGRIRPSIKDYILGYDEAPEALQKPIRTKCRVCSTEGKIEIRPEWTTDEPPVYHALERGCRSCQGKRRVFIPIDPIPYITTKDLWRR